jgi:hypothetical protein
VPLEGDRITTISLCMEDWGGSTPLSTGGCEGISENLRQKAKCVPQATAPTIHWWAKTIAADNLKPRYWCIVRRGVPNGVPCRARRGGGGWRMTKPLGAVAAAPVARATDGSAAIMARMCT